MQKLKVEFSHYRIDHPDYWPGSNLPGVIVPVSEKGYTSRQLRLAILEAFKNNETFGGCPFFADYIPDERLQHLAFLFYAKTMPACLNRDIKYRGKVGKWVDSEDDRLIYIMFKIEY